MFLRPFFLRQNETASFNQPIRMTRILWIRYFGGSLHTNSQNWWNNSKSKRWASILCLLTVQGLICEKFAPVFKQCCSAGGKKKKRKGDKVHLVVEKVCRNMIAIMFIIFNGWVVGSRVTRQTNDRILVKWKKQICQILYSTKVWNVEFSCFDWSERELNQLRCWLFCTVFLCTVFNGFCNTFHL